MTRDQAVAILLSRLGNVSTAQYTSIILTEMDESQQNRLEGDATLLPWFMITETTASSLTIGEERLALPSDFVQEFEDTALQVLNPTSGLWDNLKKDDYENMVEEFKESGSALPEKYALVGEYFRVRPVPDVAYEVRTIYFAHVVLPSVSNVENKWLQHAGDLLLAETGYAVASLHLQDMELAQQFDAQRKVARDRLWRRNEARMHANREYQMGDL